MRHCCNEDFLSSYISRDARNKGITNTAVISIDNNCIRDPITPKQESTKYGKEFTIGNCRLFACRIEYWQHHIRQPLWEQKNWFPCWSEEHCTNTRCNTATINIVTSICLDEPWFCWRRFEFTGATNTKQGSVQTDSQDCITWKRVTSGGVGMVRNGCQWALCNPSQNMSEVNWSRPRSRKASCFVICAFESTKSKNSINSLRLFSVLPSFTSPACSVDTSMLTPRARNIVLKGGALSPDSEKAHPRSLKYMWTQEVIELLSEVGDAATKSSK